MKYKAIIFTLLSSFFVLFFLSCVRPTAPVSKNNYTLLIVLAPIDAPDTQVSSVQTNNSKQSQVSKPQLDLSVEFIDLIKKYLLVPGNKYEYKFICNNGLEYKGSTEYYPNSTMSGVIPENGLYESLREAKEKGCKNSPETLSSLIHTIGEHTKQHPKRQLIIIAQTPWTTINNQTKANLKKEVEKIGNKENIKKVLFWGVQDGNLTDIFSSFNQKQEIVDSSDSDLLGIKNKIKKISELLH